MTLKSMTGFARIEGSDDTTHWHWEVRAVNGRGLDLRVRVPSGFESLEPVVRQACAKRFSRGSCSISLNVRREVNATGVRLNETVFQQALEIAKRVSADLDGARPTPESILNIKGVLDYAEADEDEAHTKTRTAAITEHLNQALEATVAARMAEGARLKIVVAEQIGRIEALVAEVEAAPERAPEFLLARLRDQVGKLLDAAPKLDEGRLHQEAALLAAKVDVEEELKRLRVHVAAARDLLESEGAVGRRLDFLAQEFNREANTLCSKSHFPAITQLGLELKAVIDQMREQVQNIE